MLEPEGVDEFDMFLDDPGVDSIDGLAEIPEDVGNFDIFLDDPGVDSVDGVVVILVEARVEGFERSVAGGVLTVSMITEALDVFSDLMFIDGVETIGTLGWSLQLFLFLTGESSEKMSSTSKSTKSGSSFLLVTEQSETTSSRTSSFSRKI